VTIGFRAVTYRMYPTAKQTAALIRLFKAQHELYNAALDHRIGAWRWNHCSVTWVDQYKLLTGAATEIPSLDEFGLEPHRGTLRRLDEAFAGFYRRTRAGQTPGFPRFKSANRWRSVTFPEATGWALTESTATYGRLRLTGVGHVKVKLPKGRRTGSRARLVVRRRGRRWEATVFYKHVEARPAEPPGVEAAGIDRGITVLAAVAGSDGQVELVDNPRHLSRAMDRLRAKQRRLARCRRGSNRRRRAVADVAAAHRRVADARRNRNHQLSRRLVDRFGTIVLEDLKVANMVRRPHPLPNPEGGYAPNGAAAKTGLNRSIADAGWGQLANMIVYKAEEAGRRVVFVNPRHTSQTCHRCGKVDPRNRVDTAFRCTGCGHVDHADLNAARNLLAAAGADVRPGSGHARLPA
jgi:putative transposase